jgi:hypothetical protein
MTGSGPTVGPSAPRTCTGAPPDPDNLGGCRLLRRRHEIPLVLMVVIKSNNHHENKPKIRTAPPSGPS